jgi:hypothetical protein
MPYRAQESSRLLPNRGVPPQDKDQVAYWQVIRWLEGIYRSIGYQVNLIRPEKTMTILR